MSITIDSESALVAFKAELLKSLTPEQREKILSDAIEHLLKLSGDRYGSRDFRNDVLASALSTVMRDTVIEVLKEPDNKTKLDAAARQVIDKIMDKIGADIVVAVDKLMRGGY